MAHPNEAECEAAGLDYDEVRKLASRLERAGKDAQKLGLHIFGGSGRGTLRFDTPEGPLVVCAITEGSWDGGDGGTSPDENGLERGEFTKHG